MNTVYNQHITRINITSSDTTNEKDNWNGSGECSYIGKYKTKVSSPDIYL